MYRLTFTGDEDLLDVVLPLLPGGVRDEDGDTFVAYSGAPFAPQVLEATGGVVDEVPADWKRRKMSAGVVIGPVCIRSPFDRESDAPIEVVIERRGSAFGSGSHPTTQMCVALMLELEAGGAVADLGCGIGTLAIVAAKLGYAPVAGVDRVPVAIEVAHENAARNGVEIDVRGRRSRRGRDPAGAAAARQRAAAGARARGGGGRRTRAARDRLRHRLARGRRRGRRATRASRSPRAWERRTSGSRCG